MQSLKVNHQENSFLIYGKCWRILLFNLVFAGFIHLVISLVSRKLIHTAGICWNMKYWSYFGLVSFISRTAQACFILPEELFVCALDLCCLHPAPCLSLLGTGLSSHRIGKDLIRHTEMYKCSPCDARMLLMDLGPNLAFRQAFIKKQQHRLQLSVYFPIVPQGYHGDEVDCALLMSSVSPSERMFKVF